MKKILSALIATAALGAMTVAASAETVNFELEGMKGTMTDVVTADGYDSFDFIWEVEDGCASICTYYFPEGGVYSYYTMQLCIPEGATLEHYNEEMGHFFTEDQLTAIDNVTYSVNEDALPIQVGYDDLTAEEARQFNIDLIGWLNNMDMPEDGVADGEKDVESPDASGETDAPADESEKASADTGVHGTVALGVAIAAAGALVLSKKRS